MTNASKSKFVYTIAVVGVIVTSAEARAAELILAKEPLFVTAGAKPNIMFIIDDSGSMHNIVPDDGDDPVTAYAEYDPNTAYLPLGCLLPLNPASGQINIRITSAGTPSFSQTVGPYALGSSYNWGTVTPKKCFDPTASYSAALYADIVIDSTKYVGGYAATPGRYSGHYLNWYFGTDPDGSGATYSTTDWKDSVAASSRPGTLRRMDIVKTAATDLITSLDDVRAGLASYNNASDGLGATINVGVKDLDDTQRTAINNGITALAPEDYTPLAEMLHDIGRYFVGQSTPQYDGPLTLNPVAGSQTTVDDDTVFNHSPVYATGVSNASPIEHYCQQNFAVLMTDGRPTKDRTIPSSLTDYDGDCVGASPACLTYDRKPTQSYELDVLEPSDYLNDVALALKDIDLRPDLKDYDGNQVTNNILTYPIGFADDQVINDPLMQSTAENGGGEFLTASNASQLTDAFESAAQAIFEERNSAASSVAVNTGSVRTGAQLYQAKFETSGWTGALQALLVHDGVNHTNGCTSSDPSGKLCPDPVWDAGCALTGGDCEATGSNVGSAPTRQIMTYNGGGKRMLWANLSSAQQTALKKSATGTTESDSKGQDRLNYLRGVRTKEKKNGGTLRNRDSLLGDIVHSSPAFVGPPSRRYPATWQDHLTGSTPENAGAQTYQQFKTANKQRMTMVYAGAGDGFLHGFETGKFDADGDLVSGTNKGKELLAYMPSKALLNARYLTYPTYTHRYYVDGAPVENDVFYNGAWHTVLVGGLGAGGQGLYALDITDPDGFSESNAASTVRWEFNDTSTNGADLGYTMSQPAVVRLHNGKWGVVVGNGYNNTEADGAASTTGNAVLYVLDVENGAVLAKLDTEVGKAQDPTTTVAANKRPNGLAAVFSVDKDADFIIDYIYAGDLFGNVWRFDLTATSATGWKVSDFGTGTAKPLFTAKDASNNPQPITTQVQVGAHRYGVNWGVMVYFGTGKYLETGDKSPNTTTTQTFYGIWDKDFPTGPASSLHVNSSLSGHTKYGFTRSNLQQQQIEAEASPTGVTYRKVTNNTVTYSTTAAATKHGWYLDLKLAGGSNEAEMVVADPVIRGQAVIFTTIIPDGRVCTGGGTGFLMVLDQATGGRTKKSPFDLTGERQFTDADHVDFGGTTVAASGMALVGSTPGFILADDTDRALIALLNDAEVAEEDLNLSGPTRGRKNWRQLR